MKKIFDVILMKRKINTLENELETIKKIIKDNLYKDLLTKNDYLKIIEKQKKEIKKLKEELKRR